MSHSKVIATGIICLAIIGSAVIYNKKDYFFGQKDANFSEVAVNNSNFGPQNPNNDEWRKTLINISPATSSSIQIITTQSASNENDNTLTGQISKEFFALYLQDKKNGVTIDQNEALKIANQTLNNLKITTLSKQYEVKDIKIIQDSSNQKMANYEQALIKAIEANSLKNIKDPVDILDVATQSENDSDLVELDSIIKNYQGLIHDVLLIEVPAKIIGYNMVYLNTLSSLLYDVQGMRKILIDPVMGYISFSNYQKDIVKLKVVVDIMNKNFGP